MERSETILITESKGARARGRSGKLGVASAVTRAFFVAARLFFCAFVLVTSVYCLLAYIPFTYQWVISFNLVAWLPAFAKFHPYLYWLALGTASTTLIADYKQPQTRRLVTGFIIFHAAAGFGLMLHPVLTGLQNDEISFIWSLVWLFPLAWLGAIDLASGLGQLQWATPFKRDRNLPLTLLATACFLSTLQFALSYLRLRKNESGVGKLEGLVAFGWSLGSHLFLFAILMIALALIRFVCARLSHGSKTEYLFCNALAVAGCAVVIRKLILPAIAFNNWRADLFSWLAAISIVVFVMGLGLKLNSRNEHKESCGLRLALAPVTPPGLSSVSGGFLSIAAIAVGAWALPRIIETRDWDFLFQKLVAVALWPITLAVLYRITSRVRNEHQYLLAAVLLLAGASAYKSADWWQTRLPLGGDTINVAATLQRYSAYDLSFRAIREIFSASADDASFYDYLRDYTNILPSTRVAPVEINLVQQIRPSTAQKPNIFVFVIDSLRRDYLSAYNESVTFTPNIDRFARESVVMQNAFTRYAGTALSEPAIWSGSMLLHKQYVLPFYPMNSLQKLLDADRYQSFISMDPILTELLRPSASIVALDRRGDGHDFDFCWSLEELTRKIDERSTGLPVFAYLQPWNVHAHVIATEGKTVAAGEQFSGFWAPYASRVKYMDACFGEFIGRLKARGLYENSIIFLTSDHGDSLGEGGRWGHSYWMYPEIVRIPLIIHLPDGMKSAVVWDAEAPAFSTDITPSIYFLLDHGPAVRNSLYGKSLFAATRQELRAEQQDSVVIASSYGAVYGVVSENGRRLFVADAVNGRDSFYDLASNGGEIAGFTAAKRAEQQRLIREYITTVNQVYGLNEKPGTAGAFDMGWQGRSK